MELAYNILVRSKRMTAMQNLAQPEKETLWLQAKEFANGRLEQKDLIRVCKALLTLEYFLNE